MQSTTSICSFMWSHMIRVGACSVLLLYLCFPAHYGFTRYMDFLADGYPTLYSFLYNLSLRLFVNWIFVVEISTHDCKQKNFLKKFEKKSGIMILDGTTSNLVISHNISIILWQILIITYKIIYLLAHRYSGANMQFDICYKTFLFLRISKFFQNTF